MRVATADDSEAVSLFRRLEEKDAEKDAADAATRGDEPRAAAAMLRDAPVSDAAEARALAALGPRPFFGLLMPEALLINIIDEAIQLSRFTGNTVFRRVSSAYTVLPQASK